MTIGTRREGAVKAADDDDDDDGTTPSTVSSKTSDPSGNSGRRGRRRPGGGGAAASAAVKPGRERGSAFRKKRIVLFLLLPFSLALVMVTVSRQFDTSSVLVLWGDLNPIRDNVGAAAATGLSTTKSMEAYGRTPENDRIKIQVRPDPSHTAEETPFSSEAYQDPSSGDWVCRPGRRINNNNSSEDADALCLSQLAATMARVWTSRPKSTWCPSLASTSVVDNSTTGGGRGGDGIVLVKVPKSASSTMAGMALHAAAATSSSSFAAEAGADQSSLPCRVEWEHAKASESPTLQQIATANLTDPRSRRRSFLLVAPIRNPFRRALSDVYYHHVSLGTGAKKSPQDAFVIRKLDRVPANFILRYISPWSESIADAHKDDPVQTLLDDPHEPFRISQHVVEQVRDATNAYDFWVVVNRIPESVAVLANLTNVSFHNYMTVPSKVGGSYYRSSPTKCVPLVPPVVTPRIREHARTVWNRRNLGDWLLYHVANRSLDLTIDSIGREWVNQQVQKVQAFQDHIRVACANETHFPCSATGQVQAHVSQESCYARDFGCGHACVRRESQLWKAKSS